MDFLWQVYDMGRVVLSLFLVGQVVLYYGATCLPVWGELSRSEFVLGRVV